MSKNAGSSPMELDNSVGDVTASIRNLSNETVVHSKFDTGSITNSFRNSSSPNTAYLQMQHNEADNNMCHVERTLDFNTSQNESNLYSNNNSDHLVLLANQNENDLGNNVENSLNLSYHFNNFEEDISCSSSSESDEDDNISYIDSENAAQDAASRRFEKLEDMLQEDSSNKTVNANCIVSKIEVLLGILKFSSTHQLSHSGTVNLCKMINSFFDVPIIPDTKYFLDQLIYPTEGITYHAVCSKCKTYISEFNKSHRRIFCSVCEDYINLKDPCYRDFYVTLEVKNKVQHLIEDNAEYYINVMHHTEESDALSFQSIYDGLKYREFVASLPDAHKHSYGSFIFNSDGSPIFKSSKFSIWPIQLILNEVPVHARNENPITYALWFGHDKPNMTYFLRSFVADMNSLSTREILCKIKDEIKGVHLYCICSCVDSVARAPMQGLNQFNGYYGCNWCLHPGKMVPHDRGSAMKYVLLDYVPPRRTSEETFQHMQQALDARAPIYGVKKATALINLQKFDIVDGFVPDVMHCIDLGIAKQFADYWFKSSNKPYSIPNIYMDNIDKQITQFRIPKALARLSRSIYDRTYWKAKEWVNWLLFYSIPILDEIPNFNKFLQHWVLLVEGYYLLLKESISHLELQRADYLLKKFVALTEVYYGEDAMTFNIHQLTHLAQSVVDWGPLWAHYGYPFESGNGKIISKVHAARGVLSQICRSLTLHESVLILEKHVDLKEFSPVMDYCYYLKNKVTVKSTRSEQLRYFGKPIPANEDILQQLNLSVEDVKAYKKIVKEKCLINLSKKANRKSDNSYVQTYNGEFIQVQQFLIDNNNAKEYTAYKELITENCMFNELLNMKKIIATNSEIKTMETKEIKNICIVLTVNAKQYICPVPHKYWQT